MFVLHLIVIIKSEIWIINHCLGLGHETMVCAVCLAMFLLDRCTAEIFLHYICDGVVIWTQVPSMPPRHENSESWLKHRSVVFQVMFSCKMWSYDFRILWNGVKESNCFIIHFNLCDYTLRFTGYSIIFVNLLDPWCMWLLGRDWPSDAPKLGCMAVDQLLIWDVPHELIEANRIPGLMETPPIPQSSLPLMARGAACCLTQPKLSWTKKNNTKCYQSAFLQIFWNDITYEWS